jgi:hypothetical protein
MWSHFLSFPHQNPVQTFHLIIRATCVSYLFFPGLMTRIIFGEVRDQYIPHYLVFSTSLLPRPS